MGIVRVPPEGPEAGVQFSDINELTPDLELGPPALGLLFQILSG